MLALPSLTILVVALLAALPGRDPRRPNRSRQHIAFRIEDFVMSLWSRIANVFRADGPSREIDEELQSHLAEALEHGRDPAEARRAFGSPMRHREHSRDVRLITWLDSLRADAIFGWRQLIEEKGNLGRSDPVARPGHRSLHLRVPAHRRAAAASVAGCESRAPLRALRVQVHRSDGKPATIRHLRLSDVSPDARRRERSSRVDGDLLCRSGWI